MEAKTKEKAAVESQNDIGMQKMSVSTFLMRYNAIIILVLLIIVAAFLSPLFLSRTNIFTLLDEVRT